MKYTDYDGLLYLWGKLKTKFVGTFSQSFTDTQKAQARTNIGAGTPVTIDSAVSWSSENPLQNKIVTATIDGARTKYYNSSAQLIDKQIHKCIGVVTASAGVWTFDYTAMGYDTVIAVIPKAFAKPDQNDPTDHNTASLLSFTNTSATGYAKRTISVGLLAGMEEVNADCNVQVIVEGYK